MAPVLCAQGSTRKVSGSGTMTTSPAPSNAASPKPPPALHTGNTVLLAVSLASSALVMLTPLAKTPAVSPAISALPRNSPCWSGKATRTTSSPRSSTSRRTRSAASFCSGDQGA